MAASPQGCRPAVYARRRPEQTALYRLVQQHLETYLALAYEGDGHAVPGYVERELRRYLECGILAYGFARARYPQLFTQGVATISWWPSPARAAASAPRAMPGAWPRPLPTWSITFSRPCR